MPLTPLRKRAAVVAALGAAALGLALTYPTGAGASTPPTNAAKVFRWGNAVWHDEFVNPDSTAINTAMWSASPASLVDEQHGMLTLNALTQPVKGNDITTTVIGHGETQGRWEARIRSEQKGSSGTPYTVVMQLVPVDDTCGADNIVMASYTLGGKARAQMYIRNGANEFHWGKNLSGLSNDGAFHTYAVEVTDQHISWFVDTHVLMTEDNPAALTGLSYQVQFALVAPPGATSMNPSRMQMDWVRYYNMKRPDAKSIAAPEAVEAPNTVSCG